MFDDLFKMIQESGRQSVIENQDVPNERNEDVLREAHTAIVNGLNNPRNAGQLDGLVESVQSGHAQSNPAVQHISDNFIGSIMQKFGINASTAASIASAIIPMVLSKVVSRGQQGGGGFDLGGLLSSLTQGGTAAGGNTRTQGIPGKMGLDKDGDGDVDLNDLTKMFTR